MINKKCYLDLLKSKAFLIIIGIFTIGVIELLFNMFSHNTFVLFGVISTSVAGFSFLLKKKFNANLFQLLSYNLVLVLFIIYMIYSMLNPLLRSSSLFFDIKASEIQIESILTIFSFSYGAFQMFGGYVLSKFKMYGFVLLTILAGLSIMAQAFSLDYNSFFLMRLVSGIGFSAMGILLGYYSTQYWESKHINLIITSLIFFMCKISAVVFDVLYIHNLKSQVLLKYLGLITIIVVILLLIILKIFEIQKEGKKSENKDQKEISVMEDFKKLLYEDPLVLLYCLLSTFTVVLFYYIRNSGYIIDLVKDFYPNIKNSGAVLSFGNNILGYFLIIFPMLNSFMCFQSIIALLCILQFIAVALFIFFAKSSILYVYILVIGSICGYTAHILPGILLGQKHSNRPSSGLMFAILNLFAMFFGGFGGSKLGIYLTNSRKISSSSFINGNNVLYSVKILAILIFAALVISIYCFILKFQKNSSNECSKNSCNINNLKNSNDNDSDDNNPKIVKKKTSKSGVKKIIKK